MDYILSIAEKISSVMSCSSYAAGVLHRMVKFLFSSIEKWHRVVPVNE